MAADGWTQVKRKPRRRRRPSPPAGPPPRQAPGAARSVGDIAAEYGRTRATWEASPSCTTLRRLVARAAAPVSLAICLGLGTLDPPDGGSQARRRALLQLAAFLVMVEELEKRSGRAVPCVFQEPVFSPVDKEFIASLGHSVVESPEACERVGPDCLLFAVHLYRPVYALALRHHLPAVFVGSDWNEWSHDSLSESQSHELGGIREMEETYEKAAFPEDSSDTAFSFSSTCIYWRPSPSASEETTEPDPVTMT